MSYDARSDEIRTQREREAMNEARIGRNGPITRADRRRAERIAMKKLERKRMQWEVPSSAR